MIDWTLAGTLLAVLAPVAAIPLAAVTSYLKDLRDQQAGKLTELASRVERLGGLVDTQAQRIVEVERSSTTREEWIRESMLARKERQLLTNAVVRLKAETGGARVEQILEKLLLAVTRRGQAGGSARRSDPSYQENPGDQPDQEMSQDGQR